MERNYNTYVSVNFVNIFTIFLKLYISSYVCICSILHVKIYFFIRD